MNREGVATRLGVGAAAAIVLLVLAPYAVADARAIGVYYGGLLGPPLAGLFAAVAGIGLGGAHRGRTDRPTAAGVVVVFAFATLVVLAPWALGVSPALVGGMTTVAAFEHHRWALVLAGVLLLGAAGAFASEVV
ncbi:MAG: hypothetical protein U5J98_00130 [Halobacteriales archaeon]|nr:hypothetical protein [Halobacteriales archaeon]